MAHIKDEELLTQEDYEKAGRMVAEPKAEKKPSNAGLMVAFFAFNGAFLTVDILSAVVVGSLTRWYYGLATLVAGAVFMFIHEWLFSRPFNSRNQRNIAIGGAVWAVLTILFIAGCTVFANLAGFFSPEYEPYYLAAMVTVIVSNIVIHGVLAGVYYYIDDQHNAKNKAARARARAEAQTEIDDAAEMILLDALRRRVNRKKMISRFKSPSAVNAAIREAGGEDMDGDGIPDAIDPIDNRTGKPFVRPQERPQANFQQKPMSTMAKDVKRVELDENPTEGRS